MKKLIATMATVLLTIFSTNAYTIDDLISQSQYYLVTYGYCDWYDNDYDYYMSPLVNEVVKLEKIDDTTCRISGIRGTVSFDFKMMKAIYGYGNIVTDAYESADGDMLEINGGTTSVDGTKRGVSNWLLMPVNEKTFTFTTLPNKYLDLIIKEGTNGQLYFEEDDSDTRGTIFTFNGQIVPNFNSFVIDNMRFVPFTGNGVAYDYVTDYLDANEQNANLGEKMGEDEVSYIENSALYRMPKSPLRTYPVDMQFDAANKTFSMINLGCNGYALDNTTVNTNPVHIGKQVPWTGKYDPVNRTLTFDQTNQYRWALKRIYPNDMLVPHTHQWFGFQPAKLDFLGQSNQPLTGTYTPKGVQHNDAIEEHGWVSNDGRRRTTESALVELEDYTFYYPEYFAYEVNMLEGYSDTKIYVGPDVTNQAIIENEHFGADDENGIFIKGSYHCTENPQYVDHYELYLIKESLSSVQGRSDLHTEHGFIKGINISDSKFNYIHKDIEYSTPKVNDSEYEIQEISSEHSVDGKIFEYSKLIPVSTLGSDFNSESPISIYLKAIYKDGVNSENELTNELSPTFHALTVLNAKTTYVPDSMIEPSSVIVRSERGNIVIEGSDAEAAVYTPTGALVYQGADRTIAVTPGLYIVRVGSTSAKVLVK